MMSLHAIDIILILIYFFAVLYIGLKLTHKNADTEDFFLAGRRLKWHSIGFSLFASNISSSTLVGLAGAAYITGVSISAYEWMAAIVLVFFAIYFIPYYIGSQVFTMPEFLEKRFDKRSRYYFSLITVIGNVFVDTAGTLFAGALVIHQFFPGIPYWEAAMVLAIVAGLYTAAGGLAAVIYTDVIQAIILLIGTTIITYMALDKIPWATAVAQTPPELLSLVQPANDQTMPWPGLLTGVPILGFYFWCTNQFIVQRVLAAKDIHHARWGALFGGFLKLPVLFIMVIPGVLARYIYPDLATGDAVFPTMISHMLPVGVKGLVLAGFIAAIMSSIDSTLHSASTLITMDFIKKLKPDLGQSQTTLAGRFVTVMIMIISVAWVPVVASFSGLFAYLQTVLAYLVPPIVAIFILGLFWKRTSASGSFYGFIVGHIFSIIALIAQKMDWVPNYHFLYWATFLTIVSMIAVVTISLLTEAPQPEQIEKYCFNKETVKKMTQNLPVVKWYQNYLLHSAIILGLTAWLIIAFF